MASNGNGKTAETETLSPRLSPPSLSPPRPIIDLPENKSDKSMSRRLGRDSPRGIAINNFYRGIKSEKLGGEIGFAFVDWEISIIRRIEILRDEISADRFPSLYYSAPRLHETRSNERKGGDCWT